MSETPASATPRARREPPSRRAALKPPSAAWFKTRQRLAGLVFLALLALLAAISVAAFNKQFSGDTMVALYTDATGNEMNIDADVSVRGVVVGQVRSITADGAGARLELAIDPRTAASLPANVTAEMLPTTLFGERYVSLVVPAPGQADGRTLAQTRTVSQDRSADAVELEKVLNDLLPMLTAVQPQKLSVTLTAIADTLEGRGASLGQTLEEVNGYLKRFNPRLPALDADISELIRVTRTYARAAPGIVASLRDFSVTSQTVASEAANLDSLYSVVTAASGNLTTFLDANKSNLIGLSADSASTLRILARYSAEFPCVFQQLTQFIPNIDKALGAGENQPGLHATVTSAPARAPYRPGADTPRYGRDSGPHCYAIPFTGAARSAAAGTDAAQAGKPGAGENQAVALAGLGLPNSPQENELVTELAAPQAGVAPDELPDWSAMLLGPLYRGTEVNVG